MVMHAVKSKDTCSLSSGIRVGATPNL